MIFFFEPATDSRPCRDDGDARTRRVADHPQHIIQHGAAAQQQSGHPRLSDAAHAAVCRALPSPRPRLHQQVCPHRARRSLRAALSPPGVTPPGTLPARNSRILGVCSGRHVLILLGPSILNTRRDSCCRRSAALPHPSTARRRSAQAHSPVAPARMSLSSPFSSPVAGVHLVGSGVGGEGYLTVRARALLQQAGAVVYDALADEELLALAPPHAARHFVGKRGGERDKSWAQSDIDALLVSLAAEHSVIVRLKAGDPFVFGRARSELEALAQAGVPCFVEPGLSSALVAPLLAGIALTDARLSKSFAVMSAFDAQGNAPEELGALAAVDTLVFLMVRVRQSLHTACAGFRASRVLAVLIILLTYAGVFQGGARLGLLCQRLQQSGRAPSTPVAVVKWAGHPDKQRIWRGTLASIELLTGSEKLSPAVIIVGETVASPLLPPSSLPPPAAPALSAPPTAGEASRAREEEAGGGGGRR